MRATTREQGKKLRELGIDTDSADLFYRNDFDDDLKLRWELITDNVECLSWSFDALWEYIPKEFEPDLITLPFGKYSIILSLNDEANTVLMSNNHDSPIDAVYEMVVQLLEHGHINRNGSK